MAAIIRPQRIPISSGARLTIQMDPARGGHFELSSLPKPRRLERSAPDSVKSWGAPIEQPSPEKLLCSRIQASKANRIRNCQNSQFSCAEIESPIVEQERRIVERGLVSEVGDVLFAQVGRQALEVSAHDDRFHKFGVVSVIIEECRGCFEIGLDLDETSASQRIGGALRVLVEPRRWEGGQEWRKLWRRSERCHASIQPGEVLASSALRLQPASRTERLKQATKQAVVIEDPVEGCGADDAVESTCKREVQQVSDDHLGSQAELRLQVFAGRSRHVLRNVQRDYTALGQRLEQIASQAASATAGVEDEFVASQLQSREDLFPPADLWLREAVVFGGIPFA